MVTSEQTVSPSAPTDQRARVPWRAAGLVVAALVVVGGGLGALGGWLWYQWWGPPNDGQVYDTVTWGPRWLDLSDQGLRHQFDGPAQYAVVALGLGILLGALAALLGRRRPLAALVGLLLGGALAAYVSLAVGTALSPPDPQEFATQANVCSEPPCEDYPAAIEVSGWTPLLSWGIAGLGAFSVALGVMAWIGTTRQMLGELPPLTEPDRPAP